MAASPAYVIKERSRHMNLCNRTRVLLHGVVRFFSCRSLEVARVLRPFPSRYTCGGRDFDSDVPCLHMVANEPTLSHWLRAKLGVT